MTREEIVQYINSELAEDEPEIYLDIDDYKVIAKVLAQEPILDKIRALPPVTPTQKWTPCSKGLPDPQDNGDKDFSDWVQITINIGHPEPKDPYVTEGYYCFSEQKWYTKRFVVGVVTAWMPLPEPYKAESLEANRFAPVKEKSKSRDDDWER